MRRFPLVEELSAEQNEIFNLPLNGTHLVSGPPGTGKTVMAIYRAAMYQRGGAGQQSQLLIYGQPLMQYLQRVMQDLGLKGQARTFDSWLYTWYLKTFRRPPPETQPFVYDWMQVLEDIGHAPPSQQYRSLIIDEGQDFPKEFYWVIKLIAEQITVFADENQRLKPQNSRLEEIRTHLGVGSVRVLCKNYRNTRQIAEFAKEFYAGLSSGIPELPDRRGRVPQVIRTPDLQSQVEAILRYEQNNSDQDIAVFVSTNEEQYRLYHMMANRTANLVQMYVSKDQNHKTICYDRPGIKLMTYFSAKGLEFDAVFLPMLERYRGKPDQSQDQMRFYVLSSRACQALFLMYTGSTLPPMLQQVNPALYHHRDLNQ